jgi:serine/threonine protein kinase
MAEMPARRRSFNLSAMSPQASTGGDDLGFDATSVIGDVQTALGAAFTLERELGGGGMSRVFLARECSLSRHVVVKLLPPELAEGINAERFQREIHLAASLQQANIVPLLSAGRAGAFPYYTMPFVEGRSLRERIGRDGALPVREALSVLRDVARALAYAHERGVVHRDIKPGNVLLSGGAAVVTDFGIAKALTAARGGTATESLTVTGVGIGTPAYMAPEQAAADPLTDHRADIYAFGCLTFEVFTGRPPFHGRSANELMAAHFRDNPPPLTRDRPDAPAAVVALVARCLDKDPERRPQTAVELIDALDAPSNAHDPRRNVVRILVGTAVVVAAAVTLALVRPYIARSRSASVAHPAPSGGTKNAAALAEFEFGQALVLERGTGVKNGIERLEHAIALDPTFARAHAGLATALELSPYFVGTPATEVKDRAITEAHRALDLDSTLAEAHAALGHVYFMDGRWDLAVPEFERAIALEPDSLSTRITYGRLWLERGDLSRAGEQLDQARRIAPISPLVSAWASYARYLDGHVHEALEESDRAIQLDSTLLPLANLAALMNVASGRKDVARHLIAVNSPAGVMSDAPYVYAKLGDTATAWRLIRGMESNDPRPWFTDAARATVLIATGDTAKALDALERSARQSGSDWINFLPALDPAYDPIRSSVRFVALIRQAGLVVGQMTAIHKRGPP